MFTIFLTAIALLVAAWAVWFLFALVRYIRSGNYDVDRRLDNIGR